MFVNNEKKIRRKHRNRYFDKRFFLLTEKQNKKKTMKICMRKALLRRKHYLRWINYIIYINIFLSENEMKFESES